MTTITVLQGERTIGGTQIVIEDGGHRLLFDCGRSYDPAGDPFRYVDHRPNRILADLLTLGYTANIPGLYSPNYLTGAQSTAHHTSPITVALSHAHLDHSHVVGFVDSDVPIVASPATARIVAAFSDLGVLSIPLGRPITQVPLDKSFDVGPMRVRWVPVDHDVCGSCGLLIETTDGVIAYSGDLRLHGDHPVSTLAFVQEARAAGARLLILEGTRLWPAQDPPLPVSILPERVEADVATEIVRALQSAPDRLGIILQSPENGERVEAIASAAAQVGRTYVMDPAGLALAYAALGRTIDPNHALYLPSALASRIDRGDPLPAALSEALDAAPYRVTVADIVADPGQYLLRLAFTHFADLLDLVPNGGGTLILSNGSPLGRFDPAFAHMEWWAAHLGLQIVDAASTGHAAPRDLALIASQSRAPVVMSIHSRHPEMMPVSPERLLLPERGKIYDLSTIEQWVVARRGSSAESLT